MTSSPTVVLVHGALTDASVWHPVLQRLQAQQLPAVAPALSMQALEGDIAAVRGLLETIEGPVVVAAHSYAGSVISAPQALLDAVGRGVRRRVPAGRARDGRGPERPVPRQRARAREPARPAVPGRQLHRTL